MRSHFFFGLIVAAALGLALLLARGSFFDWPASVCLGVQVGAALACALALLGYASMRCALSRSQALFLSVFYGGMLFRLFALGACYLVASKIAGLDASAALLSLAGVYLPLSFFELAFLMKPLETTAGGTRSEAQAGS